MYRSNGHARITKKSVPLFKNFRNMSKRLSSKQINDNEIRDENALYKTAKK